MARQQTGTKTEARVALDDEAVDGFTERDPAERSALNRLFYRNRRPTWLGHWVSQFFCWWARAGLPPRPWVALHVRCLLLGAVRRRHRHAQLVIEGKSASLMPRRG
jgi:hypothetical protein